ncbi:MAG TPA: class III poly(R)-hydroxyalkanoic acid synthase subunit PhaE [Candidatus Saccharimonadia bacterium]|nr:class III poly(R)-hydroxyalkanoic acid synthase subunit PhaE [Candidatus Saccharimonadia bacterium]
MADIPGGAFTPKDWEALNQQFWKAWSSGVPDAAAPAPGKLPWHEGLEQWSRLFAGSGDQGEVVERMLAGARQFATFAQAAGQGAGANPWSAASMQPPGGASAFANPMLDAMRSLSGAGATGFEDLAAQTQRMVEPMKQEMAGLMSMPAFGSSREQQERAQKLAASLTGYREWFGRYQGLMLQASKRAYELMEAKLAERNEPGREIATLRGLYDVWIDAAEEGYAEVALSPEFRKVYGELVNAQMRVRKHVNEETERSTQTLGMPTRTEVNAVHARLVEVRRRLARIEEALGLADEAPVEDAGDADEQGDARAAVPAARTRRADPKPVRGPKPSSPAARAGAFAEQLAASRAAKRGAAARKRRK